jgi:hypothetical protein
LEFGARHGFVVRRAYAVPRQPVRVVIVLRPEHTLLVADGEVVKYDKLVTESLKRCLQSGRFNSPLNNCQ